MNRIVLIGGMPRSGTNLVRRMIGSHSQIAIPTAEFQFLRGHKKGLSVANILGNPRLKEWGIDLSPYQNMAPANAYLSILSAYCDHAGKQIPGEKSPYNEFYFDLIESWLEGMDVKFIHMIRNPFDVIASYKHIPSARGRNTAKKGFVAVSANNWRRSVELGLARTYVRPNNYLLLKYEDLVANPEERVGGLCRFLGVTCEKRRMLDMEDYAPNTDNTSFGEAEKELVTKKVYRPKDRKGHLTKEEVESVVSICGETAWALGYPDKEFRPMLPDSLSQRRNGVGRYLGRIKRYMTQRYA